MKLEKKLTEEDPFAFSGLSTIPGQGDPYSSSPTSAMGFGRPFGGGLLPDINKTSALAIEKKRLRLLLDQREYEFEINKLLHSRHELDRETGKNLQMQMALGIKIQDEVYEPELERITVLIEEQKKFNEQLEFQNKIVGIGERVFDRAADGIMRAMQRGENAMESFRNVAMAALFDVGQEMLRLMVFAPIKKAGSDVLMQVASSIGASMFGGSSGNGGTDFDMQMAGGGYLQAGKTALVGERGKELFTPSVGGTITPNNELGGSVSVTLNLSAGVSQTVRSEVMGLMPVITSTVKNAVAEARQRGGSFSSAMGV